MSLLEELKAKETELTNQLNSVSEQYERLKAELEMVQWGINMFIRKKHPRGHWPEALLDEAERMRAAGFMWASVARRLGVTVTSLKKAVERRRKGNVHRMKASDKLITKSLRWTPLPEALLDEAERMREAGIMWEGVARRLGVTVPFLKKAVEGRRKGNHNRGAGQLSREDRGGRRTPQKGK